MTRRALKIGLSIPPTEDALDATTPGWTHILDLVILAEEMGFDSVWIADHLVMRLGESFNGHFRQECLNQYWFESLVEAKEVIEASRVEHQRGTTPPIAQAADTHGRSDHQGAA